MTQKHLFMFVGYAVKADKTRSIAIGDADRVAIIAATEQEAQTKCTLDKAWLDFSQPLSKDW